MASITDNAQEVFSNGCHTELQQTLVSEWQYRPALALLNQRVTCTGIQSMLIPHVIATKTQGQTC